MIFNTQVKKPEPTPCLEFEAIDGEFTGLLGGYASFDGIMEYSIDGLHYFTYNGEFRTLSGTHLYFRGTNNTTMFVNGSRSYFYFQIIQTSNPDTKLKVSGKLEALLDYKSIGKSKSIKENCFYGLFMNTNIINSPELLDTNINLNTGCYEFLFSDCKYLADISNVVLPHTTLADLCYFGMFYNCPLLTIAPVLPATELAPSCYGDMFRACISLVLPPELLVTALKKSCYKGMFSGCTSLTTAPVLPATALEENCYIEMFSNCTSLVLAPELPATTLSQSCYTLMFSGCTSLVLAPELPATTLSQSCYTLMFSGCTSLTTAPSVLPATKMESYCYYGMFSGCSSLNKIPSLSHVEYLHFSCFQSMFSNCISLKQISGLSETAFVYHNCYSDMFSGCTSIKLSTTKVDEYQIPYRIPISGDGEYQTSEENTKEYFFGDMFANTGGTFTGTPDINTTYYTSNEII